MPGGSKDGYDAIRHIVEKVAAQVDDGPCVTYIGPGGAGEQFCCNEPYLGSMQGNMHHDAPQSNAPSIFTIGLAVVGTVAWKVPCEK